MTCDQWVVLRTAAFAPGHGVRGDPDAVNRLPFTPSLWRAHRVQQSLDGLLLLSFHSMARWMTSFAR